ncbi:isopenicillin N synthase family oxygenase [Sessilibacter sp. MAH1]
MSELRQVPKLSLAQYSQATGPAEKTAFATALYQALSEYGFVVISDHGISQDTFNKAYSLTQSLFNLPLQSKSNYETGSGQRGYISFGKEKAAGNDFPDLKEYWHVGPELDNTSPYINEYPKNVWPEEIPEFKPFFSELYHSLEDVAKTLFVALAQAMNLDDNFFVDMITDGNSIQRLIHYPALDGLNVGSSIRAAAHGDINLMTLLIGATDSGLELLDRNGEWLAVENQEGDLVIDTGDMMARLTNNQLPATIHRVVNPSDMSKPRYSIPFFVHPRNSVMLECLDQFQGEGKQFAPISAGDFLQQRLRENGF